VPPSGPARAKGRTPSMVVNTPAATTIRPSSRAATGAQQEYVDHRADSLCDKQKAGTEDRFAAHVLVEQRQQE
jgi:hypothetical protein